MCWIPGLKPLLNIFRDSCSLTVLTCHTTINCWFYRQGGVRFFSKWCSNRARSKSQAAAIRTVTRYKEELLLQENSLAQERGPRDGVESPPWRFSKLDYPKPWKAWYSLRLTFTKPSGWTRSLERCLPVCSITGFQEDFKTWMWMRSKNYMCVLFVIVTAARWDSWSQTQFEFFDLEQVYLCKQCKRFPQFWKRKNQSFKSLE